MRQLHFLIQKGSSSQPFLFLPLVLLFLLSSSCHGFLFWDLFHLKPSVPLLTGYCSVLPSAPAGPQKKNASGLVGEGKLFFYTSSDTAIALTAIVRPSVGKRERANHDSPSNKNGSGFFGP